MSQAHPTDAEKAMKANARSRVKQGAADDKATRDGAERKKTVSPPSSTDLTGPGGDPAEGKGS
jgi:hypothetical protein